MEQATFDRSPEHFPCEAIAFPSPPIEPFERAVHGPAVEAIDRMAVPYDAVVVVVPL